MTYIGKLIKVGFSVFIAGKTIGCVSQMSVAKQNAFAEGATLVALFREHPTKSNIMIIGSGKFN